MSIDEVWDVIKAHRLQNVVTDVWNDGEIIMINAKTPRTAELLEKLFAESSVEIIITR